MTEAKAHSRALRELFFWIGIVSTILYRIIVILNKWNSTWADIAWYIGTVGFLFYFYHRFDISERRAKIITERNLDTKVVSLPGLEEQDRSAMKYIFSTLKSTKERWNYIFIFITSGLAIIIGLILDFS